MSDTTPTPNQLAESINLEPPLVKTLGLMYHHKIKYVCEQYHAQTLIHCDWMFTLIFLAGGCESTSSECSGDRHWMQEKPVPAEKPEHQGCRVLIQQLLKIICLCPSCFVFRTEDHNPIAYKEPQSRGATPFTKEKDSFKWQISTEKELT